MVTADRGSITEGSTICHGNTGVGYSLVSKQADGSWKLITNGTGILSFLNTKGSWRLAGH